MSKWVNILVVWLCMLVSSCVTGSTFTAKTVEEIVAVSHDQSAATFEQAEKLPKDVALNYLKGLAEYKDARKLVGGEVTVVGKDEVFRHQLENLLGAEIASQPDSTTCKFGVDETVALALRETKNGFLSFTTKLNGIVPIKNTNLRFGIKPAHKYRRYDVVWILSKRFYSESWEDITKAVNTFGRGPNTYLRTLVSG